MNIKKLLPIILSLVFVLSFPMSLSAQQKDIVNLQSFGCDEIQYLDSKLQQDIYEAAIRNNIELEVATITVIGDIVIFFEPFDNNVIPSEEEYGLYKESPLTRGASVPDTVASPKEYEWSFSGSSQQGENLYTSRFVKGKTKYDVVVNNTDANTSVDVSVRKKGTLFPTIDSFTVHANGNSTITNLAASSSDELYIKFSANNSFSVNGSIKGK